MTPRTPSLSDSAGPRPVEPAAGSSWSPIPADSTSAIQSEIKSIHLGSIDASIDAILDDFTTRWDRGEAPRVEDYLDQLELGPDQGGKRVELIYREFCLAGWAGLNPEPDDYLDRFPDDALALERLFRVDGMLGSSGLRLWDGALAEESLPEVGNGIGPYHLIRELGRGGFARVFLAEQSNLDDRLVVVKVSTRVTPEPGLLARASHPNIVQVLWHGEADGGLLQLICMPFLGGASLAAVLAARRARGVGAGSGRDLLDDLDQVSAEGYLAATEGSLSRERIRSLSYPKATAWIVARLAEALDFAFGRGVLHGDVKPSNVLLAADGTPKLLDFNLSVDWRPHPRASAEGLPAETGGTLAYMAPERLRSLADPSRPARPSPADRHRADIYSLGVLLLEMLTGRAPDLPEGRPLSMQELASYYVSSREHGGEVMIRTARKPLPAGLRAILSHCLAPEPADRYKSASEVAEDLDRWLTDRPLLYAKDPAGALRLARVARRHRQVLATLTLGLVIAAVVTAIGWQRASVVGREGALSHLENVYSGAFQYLRAISGRPLARGNPAEIARRHLDAYGVLDPSHDWRQRDKFRDLPPFEREELEAWLLEQALRYAHALGDRPDRSHWQRGLTSLEPVAASVPSGPLLAQCRVLRRQLGEPASEPSTSEAATPRWLNEYLFGVEAELRNDLDEALDRYKTVLALRPDSFWANYRAAVVACGWQRSAVACGWQDYEEAAKHLKSCVNQRPDNPSLRLVYAGCLYMAHRDQESIEQCDKAQSLDPDHAETYITRSFLRIRLGQFENFAKDIGLYDALTGRSPGKSSQPPGLDLARPADEIGDGLVKWGRSSLACRLRPG